MALQATIEFVQSLLTSIQATTDSVVRLQQSVRLTNDASARALYRDSINQGLERLSWLEDSLHAVDRDGHLRRILGH